MKEVVLYTDGACSVNPGRGGWCAILSYNGREKVLSGGEAQTTNNAMEIKSVIMGLKSLKEPCKVKVHSDSAYVVRAFSEGWIYAWEKRAWKRPDRGEVKNRELWEELLALSRIHNLEFVKVRGHADDENNNRCDKIARAEIAKLKTGETGASDG